MKLLKERREEEALKLTQELREFEKDRRLGVSTTMLVDPERFYSMFFRRLDGCRMVGSMGGCSSPSGARDLARQLMNSAVNANGGGGENDCSPTDSEFALELHRYQESQSVRVTDLQNEELTILDATFPDKSMRLISEFPCCVEIELSQDSAEVDGFQAPPVPDSERPRSFLTLILPPIYGNVAKGPVIEFLKAGESGEKEKGGSILGNMMSSSATGRSQGEDENQETDWYDSVASVLATIVATAGRKYGIGGAGNAMLPRYANRTNSATGDPANDSNISSIVEDVVSAVSDAAAKVSKNRPKKTVDQAFRTQFDTDKLLYYFPETANTVVLRPEGNGKKSKTQTEALSPADESSDSEEANASDSPDISHDLHRILRSRGILFGGRGFGRNPATVGSGISSDQAASTLRDAIQQIETTAKTTQFNSESAGNGDSGSPGGHNRDTSDIRNSHALANSGSAVNAGSGSALTAGNGIRFTARADDFFLQVKLEELVENLRGLEFDGEIGGAVNLTLEAVDWEARMTEDRESEKG